MPHDASDGSVNVPEDAVTGAGWSGAVGWGVGAFGSQSSGLPRSNVGTWISGIWGMGICGTGSACWTT
jgi:hypothetical protein